MTRAPSATPRYRGAPTHFPFSDAPPSASHVDWAAVISLRVALRRTPASSMSVTVNEARVATVVDRPRPLWLPMTGSSVMCVISVSLSARRASCSSEVECLVSVGIYGVVSSCEIGVLGRCGSVRIPNRRVPEPAIPHGFARRLLVFELPDQRALCIADRASEVRVFGDRHQLGTARQAGPQCDPLLFAAAVLQGDFDIHLTRIPPPQMWR